MSLEQSILDIVRQLSPAEQREILLQATSLRDRALTDKPRRSVRGLWSDLNISLSAEQIDANAQELWDDFPRKNT